MENIKSYQQYLLFYYSPNKMFLEIAPKPMPLEHWLTFLISLTKYSNKVKMLATYILTLWMYTYGSIFLTKKRRKLMYVLLSDFEQFQDRRKHR